MFEDGTKQKATLKKFSEGFLSPKQAFDRDYQSRMFSLQLELLRSHSELIVQNGAMLAHG